MRHFARFKTRCGLFCAVAAMALGLLFASAPTPVHAAKTINVVYPAGLDMEKGAMVVGWDLFMKDAKIKPVILKGQGSVARALASGKVDVGYLTFSVFARVVAKGAKLVSLAVSEQKLVWGVIARNDIKDLKALKGKRVAVHAPAGISASIIDYYAAVSGYKRNDYKMHYIRGGENRIAALLAGKLDATVAALIDANEAINTGKYKVLSVFGEVAPDVVGPMLVATQKFVKENPGTAQALVTAAVQGMRLAYDDPKRFAVALKKRAPYNDEKLLWQGHKDFMKYKLWPRNGGAPLLKTLQKSLEWFGKNAAGEAKKMQYDKGFRITKDHVAPQFLSAALKKLDGK